MSDTAFTPWSHQFSRRSLFQGTVLAGGYSWLSQVAGQLASAENSPKSNKPPMSLVMVWLQGGPSQLETFDPHFNERYEKERVGGQAKAIETSAKGIMIGEGLPRVAEHMHRMALVRAIMSKEGDHERGAYHVKSGYRLDPVLSHPSLGSILCHETTDAVEIPRHVSILPGPFPNRGGYLGNAYDAFQTFDPLGPIPDVRYRVDTTRVTQRMSDLDLLENQFAKNRRPQTVDGKTVHRASIDAARRMMESAHLAAFNVKDAAPTLRAEFGDNSFGRACLAAVQLVEVGVRCVEVTLDGWDSHLNNLEVHNARLQTLDPALAALLKHLHDRKLLEHTVVVCAGEFGRTPRINGAGGRDHWPHGFCAALAGGPIRGGVVVGETSPNPKLDEKNREQDVSHAQSVEDLHATIIKALGLNPFKELETPIGRPLALSPGKKIIAELLV